MPHRPKPFFRSARNAWFVQIGKKQNRLVDGPKTADSERAAWAAFDALLKNQKITTLSPDGISIAQLFEKYLEWCKLHREPRTYEGYVWHLQKFCDHLKDTVYDPAVSLKPYHVNEWLDAHSNWGQTYRRNAIASVKRAYAWGEEEGHIEGSPLKRLKKPMAKRREKVISPEEYERIIGCYEPTDSFREFLEFCWASGCRPIEARMLEGRHVNLEKKLIAIPPHEAKGRKRWRIIRLEGRALEVVQRRMREGRLFVNRDGQPWTTSSINCRFGRLKSKLGVKYFSYAFRHSFATRLLVRGVDHLTVAELMGHVDGVTLAKTYQHLDQADEHLREALKKS
jgi:integrase/recombinase XerC